MTTEQLAACHSRALAIAGQVRLPLRSKVWRGQAGEFTGGGTGSSLDFQDHRAYAPGDDPRHINWQAYARTGAYTMKLYREEVRPVIDIVLDASESMFFEPAKATRTAELLYLAVESASAAGASVAVHLVQGPNHHSIEPAALRLHRWLENSRPLPTDEPFRAPTLSGIPLRPNAIRILISDLLFPADPDVILRDLGQRHGSIVLLCPYLDSEAAPDWSGNCDFIDVETQARHPHRIEPATLRRYLDAYQNHFTLWKQSCRRHQSAFARIPANEEFTAALYRHAMPAGAFETAT